MGLAATLQTNLNSDSVGATFIGAVTGPEQSLQALALPADDNRIAGVTAGTDAISAGGIEQAVQRLADRALPLLASLPGTEDIIRPLAEAVDLAERLGANDIAEQFQAVVDRLSAEFTAGQDDGRIVVLHRIAEVLRQAPEGALVRELVGLLLRRANLELPSLPFAEGFAAAESGISILAALMSLESVLSEAERLTGTMAAGLDPAAVRSSLDDLRRLLADDNGTLAQRVIDAHDAAAVAGVTRPIAAVAAAMSGLSDRISAAMGMGEATLTYLDMAKLQHNVDTAKGILRTADTDPLRHVVEKFAGGLDPLIAFDLSNLPARRLDDLLDQVEGRILEYAGHISAVDVATFVAPLTRGIDAVTHPLDEISALLDRIVVDFRTAVEQIRAVIAALPLDEIASAIQAFLEPISRIFNAISTLIQEIESALQTAADTTSEALGKIDQALAVFKQKIDELFAGAKAALDDVDLDKVMGDVAAEVQEFSDLLSQAEMKPYFDTAVSAIGTAADVVGAVPFGMLPASMKQDVDALAQPIKQVDVDAFEREIESVLQIGPDGKFKLRGDVDQAIAAVKRQYDDLVTMIAEHDPRTLLQDVDEKLEELAARIELISPSLTLAPVTEAMDRLKAIVNGFDPDSALAPIEDVFTQIDATLDRYSPSQLVAPLAQRIVAARTKLVDTLKLDKWADAIDDVEVRTLRLLDIADPEKLAPPLEQLLRQLMTQLESLPQVRATDGLGAIIAPLFNSRDLPVFPSSFPTVVDWLAGARPADALAGHTARITQALAETKSLVDEIDVPALTQDIVAQVGALKTATEGLLARLPPDAPERAQLADLPARLDAAALLGRLSQNRARYLALLGRAIGAAGGLAQSGFSEVDLAVEKLRSALSPLQPARDQLQRLMAGLGIEGGNLSIAGVARALLAAASPARLTGLVKPLFVALRERLQALLTAVLAPIKAGIATLTTVIAQIDLQPLTDAADTIVGDVKAEIDRLNPKLLLAGPLAAFATLKDTVVNHDPVEEITALLTGLRDLIAEVLSKLDFDRLLETPLTIYDHILSELRKLDPSGLLDPVFDRLDAIAAQVDTGLDETVAAFKRLQEALPEGSGA